MNVLLEGLEVGDRVKILDTANDRKRIGYVRTVSATEVTVYMKRWDTLFAFDGQGLTKRGRFRLLGRG